MLSLRKIVGLYVTPQMWQTEQISISKDEM